MKKLIVLFCLCILFILPFGCDGCTSPPDDHYVDETVIQGDFVIIEMPVDPAEWTSLVTQAPKHAQMTQFDPDYDQNNYVYFYRASSDYIGYDTTKISYDPVLTGDDLFDTRIKHYTLIFRTIADTSGSD